MKKKKNIIIIFTIILAVTVVLLLAKNAASKQLNGADKRIYRIYKEDEKEVSVNFEPIRDTTEVSIMSYNIHRGKDSKDRHTLEEMIDFFKESDSDIICLQEVLFSQHNVIKRLDNYKSQYVANIDIPIVSTGVATYSKYPIIESNHIILSSKTERRGALHTAYRINNKILNVVNVHLGLDTKERNTQIKEILEFCESLRGEVILAGDFNQREVEIENFRDTGKYHGYENRATFLPKEARIDYILMTTNEMYSTTYNVEKTNLSDHYPIMTNIKYKPVIRDTNEDNTKLESIMFKLLKKQN